MQRATSSAVPARRKRRWALVVVAAALVPILAMTLFVSHRTVALIGEACRHIFRWAVS